MITLNGELSLSAPHQLHTMIIYVHKFRLDQKNTINYTTSQVLGQHV